MRFKSLENWLKWQETLHPKAIDLGLERVSQVLQRLHAQSPPFTVITVGGTNGKGSSVALLESIFALAGYRVGAYTSPHLLRYNERIRIAGREASDEAICQAFERVDSARGEISLTYFEFGTLAALDLFYRAELDVVVLEVGLGGRLDAVNIIDADVALISSIGLDHTDWLGSDRETIAREKAGIMRAGRPVVCSEAHIPQAIYGEAERIGSRLHCLGRDFHYAHRNDTWSWSGQHGESINLPLPAQSGEHQLRNASGVMMVLACLAERLPVNYDAVRQALVSVRVRGRQQILTGKHSWLVDVAHNQQGVEALAEALGPVTGSQRTHAVVGMLKDKDISGVMQTMLPVITDWYCVDLDVPRGAGAVDLQQAIYDLLASAQVTTFDNVSSAMTAAETQAGAGDRLVVFGSF